MHSPKGFCIYLMVFGFWYSLCLAFVCGRTPHFVLYFLIPNTIYHIVVSHEKKRFAHLLAMFFVMILYFITFLCV